MSYRTAMLKKTAEKLSKHHEMLARHYKVGTVQAFEPEWIAANNELELAIARVEVFGDDSILDDALREHSLAINRLMRKFEVTRMDLRLVELARVLA